MKQIFLPFILLVINCTPGIAQSEKLEIEGAIKINDSESSPPIEGTIRWNSNTGDFEGFNGETWLSLTNTSTNKVFGNQKRALTELNKITADDAATEDFFGVSVDISDNRAIVGAYWDDDNGAKSGAAYVFRRAGFNWIQEAKLLPQDGTAGDYFGISVSLSGNYAIVGAHWDDDNGNKSGSAYVFLLEGFDWMEQAKLLASDGEIEQNFGYSVSIDGNYAIVGARGDSDNGSSSGAAYIYYRTDTIWAQQAKLLADDGAADDLFGAAVDIDNNLVVVGAYLDDDQGSNSGSAYVYSRNGINWQQVSKLTATDGAVDDYFGFSVGISGTYIVCGSYQDNVDFSNSGSAYVYHAINTEWIEQAKLSATDRAANDYFGYAVSISGDYIITGAHFDDDKGSQSGAAYIFLRNGSDWIQLTKLLASDGAMNDSFGRSVSIEGDYIIIGSFQDDDNGSNSGAAYIY
jgi:hypothetical protein